MNVLQRIKVRHEAAKAFREAGGDIELAQKLFRDSQPAGIDPQLLAVLIQIALELFKLWRGRDEVSEVINEEEAKAIGLETD